MSTQRPEREIYMYYLAANRRPGRAGEKNGLRAGPGHCSLIRAAVCETWQACQGWEATEEEPAPKREREERSAESTRATAMGKYDGTWSTRRMRNQIKRRYIYTQHIYMHIYLLTYSPNKHSTSAIKRTQWTRKKVHKQTKVTTAPKRPKRSTQKFQSATRGNLEIGKRGQ